jgi:EF-hand domain pair/EF hand
MFLFSKTVFSAGLALAASAAIALACPLSAMADAHAEKRQGMMKGSDEAGPMMRMALEKFDANKDGKLDDAERKAMKADRFKKLDGNGDGKILKGEFPAAMEAMREQNKRERMNALFDAMDKNKDGAVSAGEFEDFQFKGKRGGKP